MFSHWSLSFWYCFNELHVPNYLKSKESNISSHRPNARVEGFLLYKMGTLFFIVSAVRLETWSRMTSRHSLHLSINKCIMSYLISTHFMISVCLSFEVSLLVEQNYFNELTNECLSKRVLLQTWARTWARVFLDINLSFKMEENKMTNSSAKPMDVHVYL